MFFSFKEQMLIAVQESATVFLLFSTRKLYGLQVEKARHREVKIFCNHATIGAKK